MASRFPFADTRCCALLGLLFAACDTGSGVEPKTAHDAALGDAADDAEVAEAPELRDAQAGGDSFATKPLCDSEVGAAPVGGDGLCSLDVPSPDGSSVDFTKVNLILRVGGARVQVFESVSGWAACQALQAWHYDDASRPARVVLCPEACAIASSDPDTQIQIVFGCATQCAAGDPQCATPSRQDIDEQRSEANARG